MAELEKTFRRGFVEASVWGRSEEDKGEVIKRYSVKIQRSYKTDTEWKNTNIFPVGDLLKVSMVAQEAYEYLRLKQSEKNKNQSDFEKGSEK